jgi:hypothetical protein
MNQQGYNYCKIVGRGGATETTWELMTILKRKEPSFVMEHQYTKAFNKQG